MLLAQWRGRFNLATIIQPSTIACRPHHEEFQMIPGLTRERGGDVRFPVTNAVFLNSEYDCVSTTAHREQGLSLNLMHLRNHPPLPVMKSSLCHPALYRQTGRLIMSLGRQLSSTIFALTTHNTSGKSLLIVFAAAYNTTFFSRLSF